MQRRPRVECPDLPLWARSVVLRGHLDCADDAGVQGGEIVGWDPVFEDGLSPDLVDLIPVQERPQDLESGDVPGARVADIPVAAAPRSPTARELIGASDIGELARRLARAEERHDR
jgi:hypothetical protein